MFSVCLLIQFLYQVSSSHNHNFPFTDQLNKANWVVYSPMTDEFNSSNTLDSSKWYNYNPSWEGRQPGYFLPSNVEINNGELELWARHTVFNSSISKQGYQDYSTSAVKSKSTLLYGYCEIRSKSGDSKISSAFWFNNIEYNNNNQQEWTEIDVFELSGPINQTSYFYDSYDSNTHIFSLYNVNDNDIPEKCDCKANSINDDLLSLSDQFDCSAPNRWIPSDHVKGFDNFSDNFHIYGLEWTEDELIYYVDGIVVYNITNYCLHQELYLNFDRETMSWLGIPDYNTLPDHPFTIDYVRTWTQG